ncbi:hypothetical protein Sango_1243400 [Sesamum angolense]|uniref:Reverse transcriptase/retrotransposon-derived protein RNase H-like domain-containing protein n=1 Tax=Sesamum angolense TaxID=2727404 RepID=A0AAE1WQZ2_9LAMI|nr:hypothetical protein Sango_1243400 [Sesamum angolense]
MAFGLNMEVYMDDMFIKSKEASSHVEDMEKTFVVPRKYPLKLNPGKCEGHFLRFMVTQRSIEANPSKIKTILEMGTPTNVNEAKNFKWDDKCQQAFEELQKYLAELPLLVKPSPGDILYLYLSLTSQAVSVILVREEEGTQTPIYYVSKVLNWAEGRYPRVRKMVLALVVTAR